MSGNKAITLSGFDAANPTSTMQVSDLPIPSPAANEVVVNVTLRPVNPADIFSLMGVYPGFQPKEGTTPIPGVEGMGTVHAVGEGVTKYSVGQRVAGAPFSSVSSGIGSWQQYIAVTEDCLVAIPDSVSDDAAAQLFVSPCTVVGFFQELQIPAGEYFLQTAAGSVLGRQLIQVAKHKGIKTINVVRRAEQAEELKALGADEVVVSTEEDIPARVAEITGGKGAYAAVECVGGELFASAASAVRNGGTILMYGATSGLSPTFSIPDVLFRGVTIKGFWISPLMEGGEEAKRQSILSEVVDLLSQGVITPYSGVKYALEDAVEAVAASIAEARGGKVLLEG